jgi:hypothetical protein
MKTKNIFCANEQKTTEHKADYLNGEFVFTCKCGRFLKLPGDITKAQLVKALEKHEEVNQGQVTQESVDKEKEAKLKLLDADEDEA